MGHHVNRYECCDLVEILSTALEEWLSLIDVLVSAYILDLPLLLWYRSLFQFTRVLCSSRDFIHNIWGGVATTTGNSPHAIELFRGLISSYIGLS